MSAWRPWRRDQPDELGSVSLPFMSQGAQLHLFTEALNESQIGWDSLDFPGTLLSVHLHLTVEFGSLLLEP